MQANKRACRWQHNAVFSRGTHAYPGAYGPNPPPSRGGEKRPFRKNLPRKLPPLRYHAYDSRLFLARTCRLQSQEPIEREGSSTAGEEEEEDRSPGQMVGPGVGIDKRLDDSEHPQER